jgi:hypothetical protein
VLRRRRQPAREPHPDPRVEADLQRIISMRAAVARKEQAAAAASIEAVNAERQSARISYHGKGSCAAYADRAKDLRETADKAEDEITLLHDEIAKPHRSTY